MNIGDTFLTKVLDVKPDGVDRFRCERSFSPNPFTIYGGELMAQALIAANKTVPEIFRPNNIHCEFLSQSDIKEPNIYRVTKVRDGRSLCHRTVEAFCCPDSANGKPDEVCFRMQCSFKIPENDPASFKCDVPELPPPESLVNFATYLKSVEKSITDPVLSERRQRLEMFIHAAPIEFRFCEPDLALCIKPNKSGKLHAWIRLKETPTSKLNMHRDALISYFSDAPLFWVNMTESMPIFYMLTLNQSIWFHNPDACPELNEWILFEARVNHIGGALTVSYGAMWDQKGNILASMAQQALMRTQKLTHKASYAQLGEVGHLKLPE